MAKTKNKEYGLSHRANWLLIQYRDAAIAYSWKGSAPPAERNEYERNLQKAKTALRRYIWQLENGKTKKLSKTSRKLLRQILG